MVRYLTTNGESAAYNPTTPFALRYRRARREFCKRLIGVPIGHRIIDKVSSIRVL